MQTNGRPVFSCNDELKTLDEFGGIVARFSPWLLRSVTAAGCSSQSANSQNRRNGTRPGAVNSQSTIGYSARWMIHPRDPARSGGHRPTSALNMALETDGCMISRPRLRRDPN